MSLDAHFIRHTEYLEVIVSGTYDLEAAVDKFPLVLSACRGTNLAKVLIDYRSLSKKAFATEQALYAFGVLGHYQEHLASGGQVLRVAFLGRPSDMSSYEPGVEIADSANIAFAKFDDPGLAFEWLGLTSDPARSTIAGNQMQEFPEAETPLSDGTN